MKFTDVLIDYDRRFSIGIEEESGRYFLAIPVSNRMVDYEEYYEIDGERFERFRSEPASAAGFIEHCRNREADEFLIRRPGTDRGAPT